MILKACQSAYLNTQPTCRSGAFACRYGRRSVWLFCADSTCRPGRRGVVGSLSFNRDEEVLLARFREVDSVTSPREIVQRPANDELLFISGGALRVLKDGNRVECVGEGGKFRNGDVLTPACPSRSDTGIGVK